MSEMGQLMSDFGVPLMICAVFVTGTLWLIRYLLRVVRDLGTRIGALELEYRNDLKGMIEETQKTITQNTDVQREVVKELRACRERRIVHEA